MSRPAEMLYRADKNPRNVLLLDAFNTIFVAKEGRWQLAHRIFKQFTNSDVNFDDFMNKSLELCSKIDYCASTTIGPLGIWIARNIGLIESFAPHIPPEQRIDYSQQMSEEIRSNPAYYEIKDSLLALLNWARAAGYFLALTSNNHEHLKTFLAAFPKLQTFFHEEKYIFTSNRIPVWKPQPAFLTNILQELGRTEEGVVLIGNSPYRDAPYSDRGVWTFILDWEEEWGQRLGPPLWYIRDPDIIRSTLEQDAIIRGSRQQHLIHTIFQTVIPDLVPIENSEDKIGTCPFCSQKTLIVSRVTANAPYHWHCVNCASSGNGLDFVAALLQCNTDEAQNALKNEEKLMERIEQIKQKR